MWHKITTEVRRFASWLFGSPFQQLPSDFGDPVPTDLELFEASLRDAQHRVQSRVETPATGHRRTPPAREDTSLERE